MGLRNSIDKLVIKEGAKLGVYFKRLDTGETLEYNSTESFPAASVIKIAIMMEAFNQASAGKLDLSKIVTIDKDTGGPRGSGILKHLRLPVNLSVYNLCTLMIIISDNIASNKMIDLVGFDNVTRFCNKMGAPGIVLRRYFIGAAIDDPEKDNLVTPWALGILLEKLYNKQLVSAEASEEMLAIMKKQQVNHKIPRYLPRNTVVAHKTGTQPITSHDAGIVFVPEGRDYVLVVCTTGIPARPKGNDLVAEVSKTVYEYVIS